jgi:hypothetical protein
MKSTYFVCAALIVVALVASLMLGRDTIAVAQPGRR